MWEEQTYNIGGHAQGFLTNEDDRSRSKFDTEKTLKDNTITIIL